MTLAERVRVAREGAGLTQMQLAERIGVHQGTVSAWETGETQRISRNHLRAVAEATGFALGWLRNEEGEERAPPVPLEGEAALAGFLAGFPGDRLLIVRAVIQGLAIARQPIPAWLTDLHNQYLPVMLTADEVARVTAETEARIRGTRGDEAPRGG